MQQEHYVVSDVVEREQARAFRLTFGVNLQKMPQGAGVTGDYLVTQTSAATEQLESALGYPLEGRLIEFKDDKASLVTNHVYVEYEQTNDFWWSKNPSGHDLAIARGCVLVISSEPTCFVFNQTAFTELKNGTTKERTTKYRKHGNNPGQYTRGRIVPLSVARETATFIYDM